MRFEENKKHNLSASKYLETKCEALADLIARKYNMETSHEASRISLFSNYIDIMDEDFNTVLKIRISDHTNNELQNYDFDTRIQNRTWLEIKKEVLEFVKENLNTTNKGTKNK